MCIKENYNGNIIYVSSSVSSDNSLLVSGIAGEFQCTDNKGVPKDPRFRGLSISRDFEYLVLQRNGESDLADSRYAFSFRKFRFFRFNIFYFL